MDQANAALALGAGTLAALNPCGFALLPAYLTLLVTSDGPGRVVAVSRALRMTAAMTLGFSLVFAVFGLLVLPVAASVQRYLPWFSVLVGCLLLGAGLWVLGGRELPRLRRRSGAGGGAAVVRTWRSMFGFGVSYAVASLSCTIAPFLAVVVSAFRSGSVVDGSLLFLLYAAGMGLVVGTAALAVALAQRSLIQRARRLGAVVPRAGGLLLALVGAYVAYYGWWEIRVLGGADTGDPVIDAAASVQRRLAQGADSLQATGFLVALAALVVVATVSWRVRRHRARRDVGGPGLPGRDLGPDRRETLRVGPEDT